MRKKQKKQDRNGKNKQKCDKIGQDRAKWDKVNKNGQKLTNMEHKIKETIILFPH